MKVHGRLVAHDAVTVRVLKVSRWSGKALVEYRIGDKTDMKWVSTKDAIHLTLNLDIMP